MKRSNVGTQTLSVSLDDPNEAFFIVPKFLRSGTAGLVFPPPLWRQCLLGRACNDCLSLEKVLGPQTDNTLTLTSRTPVECFQCVTLSEGQQVFVSLEHLAGFVVDEARCRPGSKPVMRPIFSGLLSPAMWLLGHPIPCVFSGPVTIILAGSALHFDESSGTKVYWPEQVVSFDASEPFDLAPRRMRDNWTSLLYIALSFDSRFETNSNKILVENFANKPKSNIKSLKHFMGHVIFALLIFLIMWLNKVPAASVVGNSTP